MEVEFYRTRREFPGTRNHVNFYWEPDEKEEKGEKGEEGVKIWTAAPILTEYYRLYFMERGDKFDDSVFSLFDFIIPSWKKVQRVDVYLHTKDLRSPSDKTTKGATVLIFYPQMKHPGDFKVPGPMDTPLLLKYMGVRTPRIRFEKAVDGLCVIETG